MFVTAWMGVLDITTGKIEFANAGHNPPLVRHADGTFEYLKSRPGFILAGMEGMKYRKTSLSFLPVTRYISIPTELRKRQTQQTGFTAKRDL